MSLCKKKLSKINRGKTFQKLKIEPVALGLTDQIFSQFLLKKNR